MKTLQMLSLVIGLFSCPGAMIKTQTTPLDDNSSY